MEHSFRGLREIVIGILVGITAMLPGISGAVICVCFGIYERIVRDLAKLRVYLKKDFWFILYLLIGLIIGTIIAAKILNGAMDRYPTESLFLFAGLIAGQLPAVWEMAEPEKGKFTKAELAMFVIGFIIMGSMLVADLTGNGGDKELGHTAADMAIMFVVGLVVAVSALMPGISHSTVLVVFGLFTAFTSAISDLDMVLLLPLLLGAIIGVLGFAKVIKYALDKYHRATGCLIFGLTAGSLVTVAISSAVDVESWIHALGGLVFFIIGLAVSIWFLKKGRANDQNSVPDPDAVEPKAE
jgi:putative membrane protein